jgi:hypothetical protein
MFRREPLRRSPGVLRLRQTPPFAGVLRDVRATGLNPIVLIMNHLFIALEKCPIVRHRFLDPLPPLQGD